MFCRHLCMEGVPILCLRSFISTELAICAVLLGVVVMMFSSKVGRDISSHAVSRGCTKWVAPFLVVEVRLTPSKFIIHFPTFQNNFFCSCPRRFTELLKMLNAFALYQTLVLHTRTQLTRRSSGIEKPYSVSRKTRILHSSTAKSAVASSAYEDDLNSYQTLELLASVFCDRPDKCNKEAGG
jgi:hypothetical protein